MKQFILLALLLLSTTLAVAATAVLEEDVDSPKPYNPLKSHFFVGMNFEGTKYRTPYDFPGQKSSFKPKDEDLLGGRLTFGGDLYLGAGFVTTSRLEGYFVGTLFSEVLNGGSQDADVKFASTKKNSQVMGVEISQSIGYIFNMKTKNPIMDEWAYLSVEPFIEFGIGKAWAYNRINYKYALPNTSVDEAYSLKVQDDLTNAKLAFGVNFTATNNFYFFIKATQNRFDLTKRFAKQTVRIDGTGVDVNSEPTINDKLETIMTYAVGGGYKF